MSDLTSQEEVNKDLWEAVRLNKEDAVRRLLKQNADVNHLANHMAEQDIGVCVQWPILLFPISCIYTSLPVTDRNRIDASMHLWPHVSRKITRQERSYCQQTGQSKEERYCMN